VLKYDGDDDDYVVDDLAAIDDNSNVAESDDNFKL